MKNVHVHAKVHDVKLRFLPITQVKYCFPWLLATLQHTVRPDNQLK